jgi:hypothetical protein
MTTTFKLEKSGETLMFTLAAAGLSLILAIAVSHANLH